MKSRSAYRLMWTLPTTFLLILGLVGCGAPPIPATQPPASSAPTEPAAITEPAATGAPTSLPEASPTGPESPNPAPTAAPKGGVKYQDDFSNPGTQWSVATLGDYHVGYHEPEWYEVEVKSPNSKVPVVPVPDRQTYGDATIELEVNTFAKKTAEAGDFRYGFVFRRSGDLWYGFFISQPTKHWYVIKNTTAGQQTLADGPAENIQDRDVNDLLRVDAQGSDFIFHVNDQVVKELSDSDYANGEVGLYVESLDSPQTHIHFDKLTVRDVEMPSENQLVPVYQDDFSNAGTQWSVATLGDYHVGYHEPEWYEVEVKSPNSKVPVVPVPDRKTYGDATIELEVNTFAKKTAEAGDFRYGFVFRRSGDLWYGFFISPTAKQWYVIKNTTAGPETLAEGPAENLHSRDINDLLRVDALGASFLFHINGQLVKQVSDSDYANGEVGLYVESLDSPQTHIHFDKLTIAEVDVALACTIDPGSTKYVRSGPGTSFAQIAVLNGGDTVKAEGKTENLWIKIVMEGSDQPSWVSYGDGYITCTPDIDLFPVISP